MPNRQRGLQPYTIPMRVITNSLDQPSPYGIGDDIAGKLAQIVCLSSRPVKIGPLPEAALPAEMIIDGQCRSALQAFYRLRQLTGVIQLKQPVQVVWHDNPGQGINLPRIV